MASPFAFSSMSGGSIIDNETATTTTTDTNTNKYPTDQVMEQMAAGAFRLLCEHLQQRSDQVQNIDLMTIGGFCRNCLAKWMVLEARKLSKQLCTDSSFATFLIGKNEEKYCQLTINALDSFGYDEAAKEVYGITYPDWKKRHQKKATDEQLHLYKESIHIHATHDAELLKKKVDDINNTQTILADKVMIRLQAGAFLSLCHHLRMRSDTVQNMELMTISGFCRNCLAKWLVVEARTISDKIREDKVVASYFAEQQTRIIDALDSFGYDEAAQYVYGCTYPEWKKHHQKKATDEQMERYNGSKDIHAKHDKDLLATRSSKGATSHTKHTPPEHNQNSQICIKEPAQSNSALLSDVCCQEVDALVAPTSGTMQSIMAASHQTPRPPKGNMNLKIGILTVSDRASRNEYETGDLSGPAVENTVSALTNQMNASYNDQRITIAHVEKHIVPDDALAIKEALMNWSGKSRDVNDTSSEEAPCDLIFTTGGTGFSTRDVTVEATLEVLDRESQGLMSWATMVLTSKQPLATLSRACAGTCGNTIIVNLPGNPLGASQVVEIVFPLLLHAVKDLVTGHMDILVV